MFHALFIIKLALAVHYTAGDSHQSTWSSLFWAPIQTIGAQKWKWRAAEFGLQVFRYTIEALTQGQGEVTKNGLQTFKMFDEEENLANLYKDNLCF